MTIHTALTPIIATVFGRALAQQKAHTDMWFRAAGAFVESPEPEQPNTRCKLRVSRPFDRHIQPPERYNINSVKSLFNRSENPIGSLN